MKVLGIETSCDETAAAVVEDGRRILSNVVASQVDLHAVFGGVVPEIASRAHQECIDAIVQRALDDAQTSLDEVAGVAVTCRPGLIGALLVGLSYAKGLSLALGLPLVGVDHILAHVYACEMAAPELQYPYLALVVSGGHTSLFRTDGPGNVELLGESLDDAAGEAFDKVASLLGLPYPGGPNVEKLARLGDPSAVDLPIPRCKRPFDFSFAGLKTAVLYKFRGVPGRRAPHVPPAAADLAASFQDAVASTLVRAIRRAVAASGCTQVAVGGGVAANGHLRARLGALREELGITLVFPPLRLCTDNAAMIAGLGYHQLVAGELADLSLDAAPTSRRGA